MKGKKVSYQTRIQCLRDSKEEREKCFRQLCEHIAKGFSLDCFTELSVTKIKEFIQLYPVEFDSESLEDAIRQGKKTWEGIGYRQALGTCLGNSRSWYYNMSNRYGWRDKVDIEAEHKGNLAVNIVSYASSKAPTA
jgi:hypothetical protein